VGLLKVVTAMDELGTARPHRSAITSQILNAKHRADPKITVNIERGGTGTKPPQNLVWTPASSIEFFQIS